MGSSSPAISCQLPPRLHFRVDRKQLSQQMQAAWHPQGPQHGVKGQVLKEAPKWVWNHS